MNLQLKIPELMAPAGDRTMLVAAINAGADAVYFGIRKLNMRAKAINFQLEDLTWLAEYCSSKNVKSYLTLNTIIYENEISEAEQIICKAKEAGIDRIILWDLAIASLCRKYDMPFCISTQGSVSNSLAAELYKNLGAVRIVLARECTLEQIIEIKRNTDLEIEAFVHGAMCIAVSGRCFLSHHLFGKSANRGECVQPCRREYSFYSETGIEFEIYDKAINNSLVLGNDYVLSPKDLCTIEFIDKLIEAEIDSFKIEGRKRSPEYVAKVVSVYRQAIDLYFESNLTVEKKKYFLEELKTVYNRGFSSGFYFGKPSTEDYAVTEGSVATRRKEYIGKVVNYFKIPKILYLKIESGVISPGDEILITGPSTGVVRFEIKNILIDGKPVTAANKGDEVTIPCEQLVRRNDSVYIVRRLTG
ncbi:MAG: peptidase U32 family protein [Ignavibacteriaceae bacterium]